MEETNILVIYIKSKIGANFNQKARLNTLGLKYINNRTIRPSHPSLLGILHQVKDFVTWGYVELPTTKFITLHPPRKGFGKKRDYLGFNAKILELYNRMQK
jgi:ribosomal protein L30/L7E